MVRRVLTREISICQMVEIILLASSPRAHPVGARKIRPRHVYNHEVFSIVSCTPSSCILVRGHRGTTYFTNRSYAEFGFFGITPSHRTNSFDRQIYPMREPMSMAKHSVLPDCSVLN
jgi:hypothetical protein